MKSKALSVTHVRIAFECPRLLYLGTHFGGKTMFYSPQQRKGVGTNLHFLAEKCIQFALSKPFIQNILLESRHPLDQKQLYLEFKNTFYQYIFYPYLHSNTSDNINKNFDYLWDGLTNLIKFWSNLIIANLDYCPPEKVIKKTFITQEYRLSCNFTLPNGGEQIVNGKLDSLVFDFRENRLCVVEYKTYQPADKSAQLAQVALYSYMLHQLKFIPIDGKVFCALPEFKQYNYPWQELEKKIYKLIPHKLEQIQQWLAWQPGESFPPPPTPQSHLCNLCPQKNRCQSFFPQRD